MKITNRTLLEQMRITEFEVEHRKELLSFSMQDVNALGSCRQTIEKKVDSIVEEFYRLQTSVAEIALLIGDSDTLLKLRNAQRRYILDIFSGVYDLEYVNNRLRIGLVHKRIGVEPKLYLAAIHTLKQLLRSIISEMVPSEEERNITLVALERLLQFDVTLVFETYIRSLVSEIEASKDRSERYAREMEEKVKERTLQLEEMSRTDALTGLLNFRHLKATATTALRAAQRRAEPVTFLYIDVDDFKSINDKRGHQQGDEVLRTVGNAIKAIARADDCCFRYGGDEFCVILSNCSEQQARTVYVKRLKDMISEKLGDVSLSIGVVQTGIDEYEDVETLIRRADEAMYIDKLAGKSAEQSQGD